MRVEIYSESALLWALNEAGGFTSRSYVSDGTLTEIVRALEGALSQARGELSVALDVTEPVADIGTSAAQV
jgi:hypothetical protein